jgi:hypothetical protein
MRRIIALLALGAFGLAACSSSDSDAPTDTGRTKNAALIKKPAVSKIQPKIATTTTSTLVSKLGGEETDGAAPLGGEETDGAAPLGGEETDGVAPSQNG